MVRTLAEVKDALYSKSETLWLASIVCAAVVPVLALLAVWWAFPLFINLVAVASVVSTIAASWLRELGTAQSARADKCRRMILHSDGLGENVGASDLAQVTAWAVGRSSAAVTFIPPYYQSQKEPGPQRLADIVAESAFFTAELSRRIESFFWFGFVVLVVASVVALNLADLFQPGQPNLVLAIAKSTAVLIAFLVSADFLLLGKKFADLRSRAAETFQRAALLRDDHETSEAVVRTMTEDYGAALLQCPPIPGFVYTKFRDELNHAYRAGHP